MTFAATARRGHLAGTSTTSAAPAGASQKASVTTQTVARAVEPVQDVADTVTETVTGVVGSLPVEVPPVQVPPVQVPPVPPVKLP